jgi:hypothetical protein
MGEFIADFHMHRLRTLPKTNPAYQRSLKFFEGLFHDPNFSKTRQNDANFDIKDAGSRVAELMQGTYDFRNLPAWAIDSGISPFFKLSRWSIEQMNNFKKYVIEPAKDGNLRPLLYATLGAGLGGAVIKEMREELNVRKGYNPTIKELAASSRGLEGNIPQVMQNAITQVTYAAYAGILGDIVRSAVDFSYGNRVQSFEFPAYGLLSDLFSDTIQAVNAIASGEADILETSGKLVGNQLKSHVQLARLINAYALEHPKWGLSESGVHKRKTQERYRDLRAYKLAEGQPVPALADTMVNQYEHPERREFKRTPNLATARKLWPEVKQGVLEQTKGQPEYRQRTFTGLKTMPYNVLPAGDRERIQYKRWLEATQGKEKAAETFTSYHRQRRINEAKRAMIP